VILAGEDALQRVEAAAALLKLAPERRRSVMPLLTQALEADDPVIRVTAARALLATRSRKTAVGVLVKTLDEPAGGTATATGEPRDASARARHLAVLALHEIGPEARPAIPALTHALADSNRWVRNLAAWTLAGLAEEGPAV